MSGLFELDLHVLLLLAGALASLLVARNKRAAGWTAFAFVLAAGIAGWCLALRVLTGGATGEVSLWEVPALGARLTVAVDPLSAFFLAIAVTIAAVATLFSVDYMTHFTADGVAKFYPVLLVFFASIAAVLVATDLLFFIVFWELMTLTSYVLVGFERERKESQRAGLKYFVITHAATLCMVAAALLLWRETGSFHFDDLRVALANGLQTRPVLAHTIVALFFIAFATKAGVLPMGDWLPDAHPAAPSGMSAALSGVLVKLGIYGLVRVFCSFLPIIPAMRAWGIVIAVAGTASLFVGTLSALRQTDSKRLMAFHTIGQIGYVCLGLGVGVTALTLSPTLAAVALMGALLHAANHACFKACLFLGAGAVLFRTGERNMDKLGGLGGAMPVTATCSGIASLSIAGVPPFNGFASKWLIVASCLLCGMQFPLFLVLGLLAMFISLVTLASFLKVMGAVFLGPPTSRTNVREVPATMAVAQVILAALCVVLGLFPLVPLTAIRSAVAGVVKVPLPEIDSLIGSTWGLSIVTGATPLAHWAPLTVLAALALLTLLTTAILRAGGARSRSVEVWTCGEEHAAEAVRYPASSFYLPFKHAIEGIYPTVRLRAPAFPAPLRRVLAVDSWLYLPIARFVERAALRVSLTHVGVPQVYLLWIVVGAVAVIGTVLLLAG